MMSKHDVREVVAYLLRQQAEDALQRKNPDVYYGWVPPIDDQPGYWLGEADEKNAEYQLTLAEIGYKAAAENTWTDPDNADLLRALELAAVRRDDARAKLDDVKAYRDRVIEARREHLINRRVGKLFLKTYRKAVSLDWDLYNPALPESLREYVLRQRSRPLGPTSVVFLYLVVQSALEHGADFQTDALTGYDYLADNPLATCLLDVDLTEDDAPAKQRRVYIRELQAQAIRDRKPPAHENKDPRDVLADFEYHGLPEQLGAMWISKDDNCCQQCKQGLRVRMIHCGTGYRYATVCPNFADNAQCHYELESPEFSTRKALKQWASVEWATAQAA
jgi:hypothetical protein